VFCSPPITPNMADREDSEQEIEEEEVEEEEDFEEDEDDDQFYDDDLDEAFDTPVTKKTQVTEPKVTEQKSAPSVQTSQSDEVADKLKADMAVMLKEQGNQFFKKGDWSAALRCYSKALEHDLHNPHLHLNKALMQIKLEQYENAIWSANDGLKLTNGKNEKGWYRRGMALSKVGRTETAYFDFLEASKLTPTDAETKRELQNAEKQLNSIQSKWELEDNKKDESYWFDQTQEAYREKLFACDNGTLDLSLKAVGQMPQAQAVAVLFLLKGNTDVRTLNLSQQTVDIRVANALKVLFQTNQSLKEVNLSDTGTGAWSCGMIAKGLETNTSVTSLNLSGCHIGRFGAASVARLMVKNARVKDINLHGNSVRDEGLGELLSALEDDNVRLDRLVLSKNNITTEGTVKLLASFNKFRRAAVKHLDLSSNGCFSELLKERASDLGINVAVEDSISNAVGADTKELY